MDKDAPYSASAQNPGGSVPGNVDQLSNETVIAPYYKPTDDNERGFLPPKVETTPEERQVEHGQSGTLIFTGFIAGEEYNANLAGRQGYVVFDEMRRSDATVKEALYAIKLPVQAADWMIEPASDDPLDMQVAADIEENLFNCISWEDFLRQALTMFDFGFSLFEKVVKFDIRNGREGLYLSKLAFRKQTTVFRWETMQKTAGITQVTYNGGQFSIPEDMLLRFTWDQEGDMYEGISVLRAAYKHWYYKDVFEKVWGIMIERQGVGIPQLTAPTEADNPSLIKARQALRNLRANEQAYIEIPKGYIIDFMDMKGKTTADIVPAIEYHDKQIVNAVMAPFLKLSSGSRSSTGSHALSQDQSRLFEQFLEEGARTIENAVNQDLIPWLVNMNYSGVTKYPKLKHGKITDDNIQVLSEAITKLVNADTLTPDPDMEQALRDMMHLPELPDDYREDYNNRPRSQASTVPIMAPAMTAPKQVEDSEPDPTPSDRVLATDTTNNLIRDLTAFKSRVRRQIEVKELDGSGDA